VVHSVSPNLCLLLSLEWLRLAAVLTTVLHLLALACLHTAGICSPVGVKRLVTGTSLLILILALWILPAIGILTLFLSFPGQFFQSDSCSEYSPLQTLSFRGMLTSLIFVPLLLIIFLYVVFFIILSRRLRISTSSTAVQKQNTRAASVTVLILISCLLCWLPASISHLLICPKGCKFSQSDVNPVEGFLLHTICNSLVILKSIFNSVVFALRHNQVRANVVRLIQCRPAQDEAKESRRRQSTRYSLLSRQSTVSRAPERSTAKSRSSHVAPTDKFVS